jgi:hypothetical protein
MNNVIICHDYQICKKELKLLLIQKDEEGVRLPDKYKKN